MINLVMFLAFFRQKSEIRKSGFIVVVEGNMDVISSHQAGVKNVVATAGTAITLKHLKTLSRFSGILGCVLILMMLELKLQKGQYH